jgi:site-specific recombinase XerD
MKTGDFSTNLGKISISLGLDRRKKYANGYNVALKFVMSGETLYHRLGWRVTESEFERILSTSTSRGRISADKKSDANIKSQWESTFQAYRERIEELAKVTPLSLETIRISLTGKGEKKNFISVWREVISQKGHGTAMSYETALKSFLRATNFTEEKGFRVTKETIGKWVQHMTDEGKSKATIGIYLRSCRVIINECINNGYMLRADYPFSEKDINKVSIPKGKSRREESLSVDQMTELYNIFEKKKYPNEWGEEYKNAVHISLGLFLLMYLANGMNLADVARLTYNDHYLRSKGTSILFHRTKTKDRTDNESEVIAPVTPQLRKIMKEIAAEEEKGERIFPYILKNARTEKDVARRVQQVNQNIRKHLGKLATSMGWEVKPSPTWCRHSFATNLSHQGVPLQYISESMGHSVGKSVTLGYINKYPHEKQLEYNCKLLSLQTQKTQKDDNLTSLIAGLSDEEKAKLVELLTKKI